MIERIARLLIIAILIVIVVMALSRVDCNDQSNVVQPVDSSFYWKNKYDKQVISQKGYELQFAFKNKKLADSLAYAYNTKEKWLQEWVIANTTTETDVKPVNESLEKDYMPVDPGCPPVVKNMRQSFHSAYYDAQVQIGDSSYMHLQGRDTVTVLWKKVKEGRFFNRRTLLQLDVSTANADTKVVGLMSYRVAESKPKRIGIGVQAGYLFNLKGAKPYVGVGVSYNFVRL